MKPTENRPAPVSDGAIYRDGTAALKRELAALQNRHTGTVEHLRTSSERIYAIRQARQAAGWVLCGGMALMILAGIGAALSAMVLDTQILFSHDSYLLTGILLASWPAAALTYGLTRIRARCHFSHAMLAPIRPTGDIHMDLERARRFDPGQYALRAFAKLEARSVAPLLAGLALLVPLTLHFLVGGIADAGIDEFDTWIALSGMIVGHCHIILAIRIWKYGKRISTQGTQEVMNARFNEGWKTYAIVLATSLFPGLLLMVVPVVIVAITGLFIPVLYGWAGRRLTEERYTLNMARLSAMSAGNQ